MPNPYGVPNSLLTRLSIARRNQASGFVAEFVAPVISIPKSAGEFFEWDQGTNFKLPDNEKGEGGVSREIVIDGSTTAYKSTLYGTRAGFTAQELTDFGDEGGLRRQKMNAVTDADMIAFEKRVGDIVTTAGSYASNNKTTLTGANQWSDSGSDPFGDIITAKEAVHSGNGVNANKMIQSFLGFNQLKKHPDILARLQAQNLATGLEDVSAAAIGTLFGLDYRVADAQYQSSDDGQSTFTSAYILGNFALVFHGTPTPAKEVITLAYSFTVKNFQMRTYFETAPQKTFVDNDHNVVTKLVAAGVGYLFTNPIA